MIQEQSVSFYNRRDASTEDQLNEYLLGHPEVIAVQWIRDLFESAQGIINNEVCATVYLLTIKEK